MVRCHIAGYYSPNRPVSDFVLYLDKLSSRVNEYKDMPLLIIGDFNARHARWDSMGTKPRGKIFDSWISEHELYIINDTLVPTCINARGQSTIDLALGNISSYKLKCNWTIGDLIPSSDHRLINIKWGDRMLKLIQKRVDQCFPRWAYKKMNLDIFRAVLYAENWKEKTFHTSDQYVDSLNKILEKACNLSMPKNMGNSKAPAYWWNDDIAGLRRICILNRRRLTRIRGKNARDLDAIIRANREYKILLKNLKTAIYRAKLSCWNELLSNLDQDPWGLPYKIVTNKLRPAAHPICESLSIERVNQIIEVLFPKSDSPPHDLSDFIRLQDFLVTSEEIRTSRKSLRADKKAPGPDGFLGGIISASSDIIINDWANCFSRCFSEGIFPKSWKTAKLTLLKKKENILFDPRNYRPICLLSECGKLFEKVIVK